MRYYNMRLPPHTTLSSSRYESRVCSAVVCTQCHLGFRPAISTDTELSVRPFAACCVKMANRFHRTLVGIAVVAFQSISTSAKRFSNETWRGKGFRSFRVLRALGPSRVRLALNSLCFDRTSPLFKTIYLRIFINAKYVLNNIALRSWFDIFLCLSVDHIFNTSCRWFSNTRSTFRGFVCFVKEFDRIRRGI